MRKAKLRRTTTETDIRVNLNLDGQGRARGIHLPAPIVAAGTLPSLRHDFGVSELRSDAVGTPVKLTVDD